MDNIRTVTDYLGITHKQPEQISWCLNVISCGQNILTWIKENPWICLITFLGFIFLFWFISRYNVNVSKRKRPRINKTENFCRSTVEKMFNHQFPSVRPDWLNNSDSGKNLELDMYNEKLKLAFEYDGAQHAKFNKFFHKSMEDFEKQKERDRTKEEICKNNGIKLIRIPHHIKKQNIKQYILDECDKNGICVPNK